MIKWFFVTGFLALAPWLAGAIEPLSDEERAIVATCMVLEAGCDGAEGMQAVLNVILNRARSCPRRMVPEIIRRGAFSCMSPVWNRSRPDYNPLIRRAQNQPGAYSEALRLIDLMERGMLRDNTHGATHFHAVYIEPYWAAALRYLTTIGGHHFYTDRIPQVASL